MGLGFFVVLSFFAFKVSNTSTPSLASLPKAVIIERDTAGRMVGVVYARSDSGEG
jgi:hypothetical protein